MFKVTNGQVEVLLSPFSVGVIDPVGRSAQAMDQVLEIPSEEGQIGEVPSSRASFPTRGFRFVSKIYFIWIDSNYVSDAFKKRFFNVIFLIKINKAYTNLDAIIVYSCLLSVSNFS